MKKTLKNIWLDLIQSRVWIALGTLSVLLCSSKIANSQLSFSVLFLIFVGAWFVYFMQKYLGKVVIDLTIKHQRKNIGFIFIALLFVISFLFQQPGFQLYAWLILFSLPSLAYPLQIQTKKRRYYGLREIPYVKILVVAVVWEFIILLPWFQAQRVAQIPSAYACMMFFYLVAIILPFDVRDMHTDAPEMQTIAQMIGSKNTYLLCNILIGVAGICNYILYLQKSITASACLMFIGILMLTALLLWKRPKASNIIYYEGMLDGTLLLWGLICFFH